VSRKVLELSKDKFGSNVVEKCFSHGDSLDRQLLFEIILGLGQYTVVDPPLVEMMKDEYGNYVIQKMVEFCTIIQKRTLRSRIQLLGVSARTSPFTKYTLDRLEESIRPN
jgi:pumilio RNA-binding family